MPFVMLAVSALPVAPLVTPLLVPLVMLAMSMMPPLPMLTRVMMPPVTAPSQIRPGGIGGCEGIRVRPMAFIQEGRQTGVAI